MKDSFIGLTTLVWRDRTIQPIQDESVLVCVEDSSGNRYVQGALWAKSTGAFHEQDAEGTPIESRHTKVIYWCSLPLPEQINHGLKKGYELHLAKKEKRQ